MYSLEFHYVQYVVIDLQGVFLLPSQKRWTILREIGTNIAKNYVFHTAQKQI